MDSPYLARGGGAGWVLKWKYKEPAGGRILSAPPGANFENISLVLEYFVTSRPGSTFVQIGANDGQTSDSVNEFVKRGVLRSILVEPIHANFLKLSRFYQGVPNVYLVQAAIARDSGSLAIHAVKDVGRWAGSAWATQLASFDKQHLIRYGIRPDEIQEYQVETINLPDLMKRQGIDRIDVLQVDVEGYDAEVVKMALELENSPLVICFEFSQFIKTLNQQAVDHFYNMLSKKGYAWSNDYRNTMAIHQSLIRLATQESH